MTDAVAAAPTGSSSQKRKSCVDIIVCASLQCKRRGPYAPSLRLSWPFSDTRMVLDEGQEDNPAAAGTSEYEKEGPEARPCWTLDASVWCQFGFFRGIVDERARSGQPLESGDELRLSDDVHEIMDVVVYRCRIRRAASAKDLAVWYEQLLGAVGQARMLSLDLQRCGRCAKPKDSAFPR